MSDFKPTDIKISYDFDNADDKSGSIFDEKNVHTLVHIFGVEESHRLISEQNEDEVKETLGPELTKQYFPGCT
ncbi:MAG: hypothetical protein CMH28_07130 [Micavibrio sp.]|nr:hypothetical protein [Micavibrio sp.]|tara:strand:+ start:800 stop:1018 length:219 start_codon:yes stop_codon:yes gene_type:complete